MKVEISIDRTIVDPYAVIHTPALSAELEELVLLLEREERRPDIITVKEQDKYIILNPEEIYMIRLEEGNLVIHTEHKTYFSGKRLYELEEQVKESSSHFMRISKTTLINLKYLESVEPSFSGMMYLKLKNNCRDYISRKYLQDFKKYLGL